MRLPDLPNTVEEIKTQPQNQVEFTVKPTGEFQFKGIPNPEIVSQLLTSSDYQSDRNRSFTSELERRVQDETRIVNLTTIGFLGASFLICIVCIFLTLNKQNNRENLDYARQSVRGTCSYQ